MCSVFHTTINSEKETSPCHTELVNLHKAKEYLERNVFRTCAKNSLFALVLLEM